MQILKWPPLALLYVHFCLTAADQGQRMYQNGNFLLLIEKNRTGPDRNWQGYIAFPPLSR